MQLRREWFKAILISLDDLRAQLKLLLRLGGEEQPQILRFAQDDKRHSMHSASPRHRIVAGTSSPLEIEHF
jgi:hypothetical protein